MGRAFVNLAVEREHGRRGHDVNQAGLQAGKDIAAFEPDRRVAVFLHGIDLGRVSGPDKHFHFLHVIRGEHRFLGEISDPAGVHPEEHDKTLVRKSLLHHRAELVVDVFDLVEIAEHHRQTLQPGHPRLDLGQPDGRHQSRV